MGLRIWENVSIQTFTRERRSAEKTGVDASLQPLYHGSDVLQAPFPCVHLWDIAPSHMEASSCRFCFALLVFLVF